jgi:hypothetical protein
VLVKVEAKHKPDFILTGETGVFNNTKGGFNDLFGHSCSSLGIFQAPPWTMMAGFIIRLASNP